jgi:hypothetical protein
MLEKLVMDVHSRSLRKLVNYGLIIKTLVPACLILAEVNTMKVFEAVIYGFSGASL